MVKGVYKILKTIYLLGDLLLLNLSFILAYLIQFRRTPLVVLQDHYFFLFVLFNLAWFVTVLLFELYVLMRVNQTEGILINVFKGIVFHSFIVFTVIVSVQGFYFSRKHLLYTYLFFIVAIVVWRFVAIKFLKYFRSIGVNARSVIIVGAGGAGNQIYHYLKTNPSTGLKFKGFFDDFPENCFYKDLIVGNVNDVKEFAAKNDIKEIFCALPLTSIQKIRDLMSFADNHLIHFSIVPDFRGFYNKKVNLDFYDGYIPILTVRKEPLENLIYRFNKRVFDIVFSLGVILFIFPIVFPIIALFIKLSSKGPIFFVQKRSGRRNEQFNCYKFRTMTVNADADKVQATKGDARLTKIGKFLRKSNLDELPQFINVLIGNMSVVGPRPHMLSHTKEYSEVIDKFMVRHLVKPGITGWAQVNGFRGPTVLPKQIIKRIRYDIWYLENWSMYLDLKIIFLTVFNMAKGEENAH